MKINVAKRGTVYKLTVTNGTGKNRTQKTLKVASDSKAELDFIAERMNKEIVRKSINSLDELYEAFPHLNIDGINDTLSNNGIVFVDYLNGLVENKYKIKAISNKTYLDYKGIIERHIAPFFKGVKVKSLRRNHIKEYVAEKSNLSRSTINLHLNIIKMGVKNAIDDGILDKDITVNIEKPKATKKEQYVYSSEEVLNLLNLLKESDEYDLYIQVILASGLGLRNSEILGLCWDCIDFNNKMIEIKRITSKDKNGKIVLVDRTKTDSSTRKIQAPDFIIQALKEYKKDHLSTALKSNLLFHKVGKPLGEYILSRHFSDFLKKNDLPKTRLHDLRHYFASALINENIPITLVSKILGHSNTNITTSVYAHVLNNANESAGEIIQEAIYK